MARVKSTRPKIRRKLIGIPLMLLSVFIVVLAVFSFITHRSQGIGIFKSELDKITEKFETVEARYADAFATITANREPIAPYLLDTLEVDYQQLLSDYMAVVASLEEDTSPIAPLISQRVTHVSVLRTMNEAIRVEGMIGPRLLAYDECLKSISYRQKATDIYKKLQVCGVELAEMSTFLLSFPPESISNCAEKETPGYILQQKREVHSLFERYYALTSQMKAKDAAATDLAYQRAIRDFNQLPEWNSCITQYLQESLLVLAE